MFYTYLWLREDGSPYYVGKGSGSRAYDTHRSHRPPKDKSRIIIQPWVDEETAFAYERYQIDFWGRKDLGVGILRNLTDGGEGLSGHIPSEETKRRRGKAISIARLGHIVTEETRAKLRAAKKLQAPISVEARKKLSASNMGHVVTAETRRKIGSGNAKALKGRTLPEEVKLKISASMKSFRASASKE